MSNDTSETERDCAVCLQKCHHPTQLPCGHIFCFLCVKGVAIQNKKCAMCRAVIPRDYLDNPILLKCSQDVDNTDSSSSCDYQWYYEGRNGWWKYDERSNCELEASWSAGETECRLLVAGALYCIDFRNMVQTRHTDWSRRRKVHRDTPSFPAKGIAGIKIIDKKENTESPATPEEVTEVEEISQSNLTDSNLNSSDDSTNEVLNVSQDVELEELTTNFSMVNVTANQNDPEETNQEVEENLTIDDNQTL